MQIEEVVKELATQASSSFVKRKAILDYAYENNVKSSSLLAKLEKYKCGHGKYDFSPVLTGESSIEGELKPVEDEITENPEFEEFIPLKNGLYNRTTFYPNLSEIIKTKEFFPVMITGPSGIGKTLTVEQICADLKRELIRVNISHETDEDSLIGGFRLQEGSTVFFKGPVITAMERGAVLLLDEVDLGTNRLMCLQSVCEGKGYFLKRVQEFVSPRPGFTIVATANTKGQGDEDGTYIGTNIMNEAFLDRFPIMFEVDYPTVTQEKRILRKIFDKNKNASITKDMIDETIHKLTQLADQIRKTVKVSPDLRYNISTRRLVDIARTYMIFGDLKESLDMCITRFDEHHKKSYMNLYQAITAPPKAPEGNIPEGDPDFNLKPF